MSEAGNKTTSAIGNIRVIEFADYITPEAKECEKEGWVEYGDDNAFFDYLVELYNNSPTNSACVRGTSNLIYGQGLEAIGADKRVEAYTQLQSIFRPKEVRNVCNDFKAFGMAAFELIMTNGGKVKQAYHIPMPYLRSGIAAEDGRVKEWHYATNWENSDNPAFKTERIPVFGEHGKAKRAIQIIRPYSFGSFYYSTPDYIGALAWADVESEISNYHLSNLQNGMWPGMLVNFNNGVPDEDEQDLIEKKVHSKFGRTSKTGRMIIAFNRDKDSAATIEPVQLSDAAEQFQAVQSEATEKILLAHRITSPMLVGIKNQTGLGNNADELKTAHALFQNTVVSPMQDPILEAIQTVLIHNGINLQVYFKPLTPLEFKKYEIPVDDETMEKDTGIEMSHEPLLMNFSQVAPETEVKLTDEVAQDWETHLSDKGEKVDLGEWELIEETVVNDPESEPRELKFFKRFADPQDKSKAGDAGLYKVRYRYSQNLGPESRTFCKNMVANSKSGVVYRREDIDQMTDAKLNIELSPADCKRCGYDLWLYKGGANCHHRWVRQVYMRKRDKGKILPKSKTDSMENDKRVSVNQAGKAGVPQDKLKPKGWDEAKTRPIDTPSRGYKTK